jgi:hypothetical protein
MLAQALAVGGYYACRFLSAMLQGVQPEVGEFLRLGVGVDGDYATFIAKFVGSWHFVSAQLSAFR